MNGHVNAVYYSYSFFLLSLEVLSEAKKDDIINAAISHRGAKVEKFDDFIKSIKSAGGKREVDHAANIAMLKGKLR